MSYSKAWSLMKNKFVSKKQVAPVAASLDKKPKEVERKTVVVESNSNVTRSN